MKFILFLTIEPFFNSLTEISGWADAFLKFLLSENNKADKIFPAGEVKRICYSRTLADGTLEKEISLPAPESLLIWNIENIGRLRQNVPDYGTKDPSTRKLREKLFSGDKVIAEQAIEELKAGHRDSWYIFEGKTRPDILIEMENLVLIGEGKRTERCRTTYTTWLEERDQLIRHLDAAYDPYKHKKMFGFIILEGDPDGKLTDTWENDLKAYSDIATFERSLPHRNPEIIREIYESYIGHTTWNKLSKEFNIYLESLGKKED